MKRISSQLPAIDNSYYTRIREWELNQENNKIASQSRIKDLRDDPLAAARAVRLDSAVLRAGQYQSNVQSLQDSLALSEGELRSALDLLQRVRELSVEGANGIYDATQYAAMGAEVDQVLNELVTIANARDESGNYLFSGTAVRTEPFRATRGRAPGGLADVVTGVDYLGNAGENPVEITEGADLAATQRGNWALWAEQQEVFATVDASRYRVQQDSTIRIDGTEIALTTGDSVAAIMAKVNDSGAAVRAQLDPITGGLVLATTVPHQLWLEDLGGSSVLQDLGVLARGSGHPPLNLASSARVVGGSIFDVVIHLRDALMSGSAETVGSSGLAGIETAITALSATVGGVGAKDNRLSATAARLDWEKPELVRFESQEKDLDLTEAITRLRTLEYGHEAALAAAARILQPTLLNFLK